MFCFLITVFYCCLGFAATMYLLGDARAEDLMNDFIERIFGLLEDKLGERSVIYWLIVAVFLFMYFVAWPITGTAIYLFSRDRS